MHQRILVGALSKGKHNTGYKCTGPKSQRAGLSVLLYVLYI